MPQYEIILCPHGKSKQIVPLFDSSNKNSYIDSHPSIDIKVFSDLPYEAFICSPFEGEEPLESIDFFINDFHINTEILLNGNIVFKNEEYGNRIFSSCYGFIQISMNLSSKNHKINLSSPYVAVMVRKGKQNNSVRRMVEYIYKHNEDLLYQDSVRPRNISDLSKNENKSMESRIALLKEILYYYEEYYSYFKVNSRFKTDKQDTVDSFERLQFIADRTIKYLTQHPEQLVQVNYKSGIEFNGQYYQPQKTLMAKSIYVYDIYENQIVVGFLKTLILSIDEIRVAISNMIKGFPDDEKEIDGYVLSSFYIYSSTKKTLSYYQEQLNALSDKYNILFNAYSYALKVTEVQVCDVPKPTAIFLSIPQYFQIYDCIILWFKMGIYDLKRERFMLSFLKGDILYECYVLSKLYSYFKECGYELISSYQFPYSFAGKTLYQNVECNNTFVFSYNEQIVTLYYQPVIYSDSFQLSNGIEIYRNTSISYENYIDKGEAKGVYYSPDYLIKIEKGKDIYYLISDAKFSTISTVKRYHVPALAFKYIFSISPANTDNKLLGLCIFNGQSDEDNDVLIDIYDRSMTPGKIFPQADIITLTENKEENSLEHANLFSQLLNKYLI
ncbi:hypothetical protein [Anaeropeptidivorans aminofermentans]|uniref:hypothetical protein n=1 Tax=Anaeropeptidivorans aminofermentans TaxID=2934315 RepID=UPI002023F41A|nr:hypothetical protein [Anaeropeptidivorans aminofermentans]